MSFVREFFLVNRSVLLFVYGQVFFVLGLAIAIQSRRYSRLDLARSLKWLAAFGLLHGLYEWGDLFIPLQATYLAPALVQLLEVVHLVLLGVSFACLFEFGVAVLRPFRRGLWLYGVPLGLLVVWLFVIFFVWLPFAPDQDTWSNTSNALARYGIGFPGALLAAYGLREQALRRIAPLNVPHIVYWLRVAGLALAGYALVGGLIVPRAPFFPAAVLNTSAFTQALGVPPLLFRSLIGLFLLVAIVRALEVFDVETERLIETMEQQQILAAERERIGRELHDGAIQSVYTAGLLVESARRHVEPEHPVAGRLDRAIAVLNDAIRDLRRTLGELRPGHEGESLPEALRRLAADPRYGTLIDVSLQLDFPGEDSLSELRTGHVLAIVNEALSNVVRHARATRARIEAARVDGRLRVTIRDNGIGLPREPEPAAEAAAPPPAAGGYGLRNMRDRARLLGGQLTLDGAPGKGTRVVLDIPWQEEH